MVATVAAENAPIDAGGDTAAVAGEPFRIEVMQTENFALMFAPVGVFEWF
jgi:hypothetical protein